jgi:GDP/UDP-N,N'-diacetylbacillosamine 2-epimerase (hydrolysing)
MGQLRYLSALQFMDGVVGNSSSGLLEAPSFKIGTINIGDRQRGRIKVQSVIDCEPTKPDIKRALVTLFSSPFQKKLIVIDNPYGSGGVAQQIVKLLKKTPLDGILKKSFYNINYTKK